MADENQMGSDLSPVDPAALNWVEYWYPIAWKGLLVAGLITVIGAVGSIGFLLLQWRASGIREQQSDWRTSVLEVQAKKADADLVRAKANIADANARAAGAQAEATHATERASALEADAAKAQERTATLEKEAAAAKALVADADARAAEAQLALEKFKSPRTLTLEQQARITAAVMPYSGQEYTLSVVPGSEAENLLCTIDAALTAAQWKRVPGSYSITVDTKCGTVGANTLSGLSVRLSDKAETEQQWNVLMLVNALRAEDIAVDGAIDPENASPTAIAVMVGSKPY